jgi:hypothetical protein
MTSLRRVTGWRLSPRNITAVDDATDRDGLYAKGYWREVDGKLQVVGLRIGHDENRIVAYYGDTVTRRADGTYSIHPRTA